MSAGRSSHGWTRWEDWGAVILGAYLALAPIWTTTSGIAVATMIVLGVLLFAAGLWSLSTPDSVSSEYVHMGLGVLMFISPWVMGFTSLGAAWTAWAVGVLSFIVGAAALPAANAAHSKTARQG